jgi:hypothetical protein
VSVDGGNGWLRKTPDSQAKTRQAVRIFAMLDRGLWASAFKASKSMPEQNAFPAPVRINTFAGLASISLKAKKSSAIISAEIALRFSGRFSVIVAMSPVKASWRVPNVIR